MATLPIFSRVPDLSVQVLVCFEVGVGVASLVNVEEDRVAESDYTGRKLDSVNFPAPNQDVLMMFVYFHFRV
jgi:hypothetical protein